MEKSRIKIGADPELFFKDSKGVIVGSERVIPEGGITVPNASIVRDGVQLELHPIPSEDISIPMRGIQSALLNLDKKAKENNLTLCFDEVVDVSLEELEALSPESRKLGCQPSENFYGFKSIKVDPLKYRKRSAGGHVHLGVVDLLMEHRMKFVPILDLLVGIPGVLFDRDPRQVERRKLYGRAGEYRLPMHGLEYRTLSNFWLHSPVLTEFFFLMSKVAVDVLFTSLIADPLDSYLLKGVDLRLVTRAIQKNDVKLARTIWNKIVCPFLTAHAPGSPIGDYNSFPRFTTLLDMVAKDGLKAIGGEDKVENWRKVSSGSFGKLWDGFLKGIQPTY